MAEIAFIGAGVMGREMALQLIGAGHNVRIYNRTASKTGPIVEAGAIAAASPAEAADNADYVISMVGDDEASRRIWLGDDGVMSASLKDGAVCVESSTLSQTWVVELGDMVGKAGFGFIDCPVTGGPDGASEGRLTLLVGAEKNVLDSARDMLSAYSRRIIHFGGIGKGTAYKVMVNLVGAAQAVAVAEGMLAVEKAGLDMEKVAEALASGAVASPMVKYMAERMLSGDHEDVYFSARWRHKDALYGLQGGVMAGQAMPVCKAAEKVFRQTVDSGLGDKNSSIVIETLRDMEPD